MKAKTQLWHIPVITLALLITACGGSSGSAGSSDGNGPVNWDYETCDIVQFFEIKIPDNRIEENLYAGQSITKEGTVDSKVLRSFQFSLQDSGTITVSKISVEYISNFLVSANDCTKLPLTGKVSKGPYYVSISNYTDDVYEYSLKIDLK